MKYLTLLILILLGGYYGFTHSRIPKMDKLALRITNNTTYNGIKVGEIRKIESILAGTPAKAYAADIWEASDAFRVDYRILLGIIKLESSYFKHTICNNGTGLGIYGTKKICFNSFKENIFATAKTWSKDKRYTILETIREKGCMYNKGTTGYCEYGVKLAELIKKY